MRRRFHFNVKTSFLPLFFSFSFDVWLGKYRTKFIFTIVRKSDERVGDVVKEAVVCKNADEKVLQIIPCVFKIIQLDYRGVAVMEDLIFSAFIHIGDFKVG